ncbi:MAG: 16S rRNA (cytidine(1402)-2'-O)-methyltransferase [Acidimicrobiales bacterium]|nr:16S rRNA (cytidine(1402)-2'-O)-methyltransferase [Acidimicrobiales bacterium]MYD83679.1 16S rRNA (cytidine(1402)-2'-O)-methyltransferase [Acidimicrobiales bacterium]MYJ66728.1 16S rRNA (cytidine(1402)-2'-O)-methyltransferase [Acidimicrobiales bacterium]
MSENEPRLWLVATPIGNLDDIAPRAVEVLSSVSFVACEDTRRSGLLLQRLGIAGRRLVAMHEHNEATVAAEIVQRLKAGETAAYITDAGMPAISDPGQRLVAVTTSAGIGVSAIPGPSAPVTALAVSGLPTDRWVMEGFLPRKGRARSQRLDGIAAEQRTVILLESPKRLGATLDDLAEVCSADRPAVVVREMTKLHEEVARGTVAELAARFAEPPRGEIVVVLGPAISQPPSDAQITAELHRELDAGATPRDAATAVAQRLGVARNRTYRMSTELARSLDPRMP